MTSSINLLQSRSMGGESIEELFADRDYKFESVAEIQTQGKMTSYLRF